MRPDGEGITETFHEWVPAAWAIRAISFFPVFIWSHLATLLHGRPTL
jgi:hypothetical protein